MVFKPLSTKVFLKYVQSVGWTLEKGGIDWNLRDEHGAFLCSIKIAYGKNTKEEVVAYSVNKTERIFKEKGFPWPPKKKK